MSIGNSYVHDNFTSFRYLHFPKSSLIPELAKTGHWLGGTNHAGFESEAVKALQWTEKTEKACKLKLVQEEADMVKTIFDLYMVQTKKWLPQSDAAAVFCLCISGQSDFFGGPPAAPVSGRRREEAFRCEREWLERGRLPDFWGQPECCESQFGRS